jgi:hypothetical protein
VLFQVVENTYVLRTVTAEVASSSLVVPAIFFQDLIEHVQRQLPRKESGSVPHVLDSTILVPDSRVDVHGDAAVGMMHERLHGLRLLIILRQ